MRFADEMRFALGPLHGGRLNLALHAVSIVPLAVGLVTRRPGWVLAALGLETAGHAWNYVTRFGPAERRLAWRVLPLQVVATTAVGVLLFWLFGWF